MREDGDDIDRLVSAFRLHSFRYISFRNAPVRRPAAVAEPAMQGPATLRDMAAPALGVPGLPGGIPQPIEAAPPARLVMPSAALPGIAVPHVAHATLPQPGPGAGADVMTFPLVAAALGQPAAATMPSPARAAPPSGPRPMPPPADPAGAAFPLLAAALRGEGRG